MEDSPITDAGTTPITAWIMTISDRCALGECEDRSGPLAISLLADANVTTIHHTCVPDEIEQIQAGIRAGLAERADLIFTTGGTGIAPRDHTPEATEPFLSIRLDGITDAIRRRGEATVATALISRGLAGVAINDDHRAIILNAPGSPGGVRDAIAVLAPLLPHVIDQLIGGDH